MRDVASVGEADSLARRLRREHPDAHPREGLVVDSPSGRRLGPFRSGPPETEEERAVDAAFERGISTLRAVSEDLSFPQVYIDGELIGGCDITLEMHANGDLQKAVAEAAKKWPTEDADA